MMKDDDINQFANQFINLWQENFSKAIADQKIIEMMMAATANMQQFYDKSTAATFTNSHSASANKHDGSSVDARINALESRITELEKQVGQGKKPSRKRGKK